jgi:hypothetical protein
VPKQQGDIGELAVTLARDLQETFRLRPCAFAPILELDNKALRDVEVLAQYLRFVRESNSARKLVLVGFTDSVGAMEKNLVLSLERANAVRHNRHAG